MSTEPTEEQLALVRLKMARNQVCRMCEKYIFSNAPVWNWERCWAMGTDANGVPNVELDNDRMGGPEDTCPLGKWLGVVAVTQAQIDAEHQAKQVERAAVWWERMAPIVARLPDEAVLLAALDEMEQKLLMDPVKIAEIRKLANA